MATSSKLEELMKEAKSLISVEPGRTELWRAYVAIEYCILDLKLRHGIEGEAPPARRAKKAVTDLSLAKSLLDRIDLSSDDKKLLYDLRACRDVLKSLVASYDRRSTTS